MPAPPHDESGHTWHHSDRYLIHVVQRGIVAGEDRPSDYQGQQRVACKTRLSNRSFVKLRVQLHRLTAVIASEQAAEADAI